MTTYSKTITADRLKITYDDCNESPREWGNLGKFITNSSRHNSPDKDYFLEALIKEAYEGAKNVEEHTNNVVRLLKENSYNPVLVLPINRYEHSGVRYYIGSDQGWDVTVCGFYIICKEDIEGIDPKYSSVEELTKMVEGELTDYNKYCNGEIYHYELLDKEGEFEDSCGGFYNIEDIREYLPEEFKDVDLTKFLK